VGSSTTWQLARDAAERYQGILTPTILGPFADALVQAAAVRRDDAVLDVGCGTGAAAIAAARTAARVVGADVNAGMLDVARSLAGRAPIEWVEARAERLPFGDASFDLVLCAQTLQFVADRELALLEMHRVLRPGGRLAVSVWAALADNPYFETLIDACARHLGEPAAAGLRAVFSLADARELEALMVRTGWRDIVCDSAGRALALPPLAEFVPRHLSATPLAAAFAGAAPATQRALVHDVVERAPRGAARFRSHIVRART
jgi:SAM-dependent methyltransferase